MCGGGRRQHIIRRVPAFVELFGRPPDLAAEAPGRVNLIGEHTDYNGGLMLPTPLPQRTRVELARRADRQVRAFSATIPTQGASPTVYTLGAEARTGRWIDYVQGATQALARAGFAIGGVDLRIESQVPRGGGVSSSAALLVALLRGLRERFELALDDVALAHLARRAENELVGAPVGIMDPLVCSVGRPGQALLIDADAGTTRHVALPADLELVVVDSGVHHSHAAGDYRTRKAECDAACVSLGVASLRAAEALPHLEARLAALPAPLEARVRHVVSENARVRQAVAAMESGDTAGLGAVLNAGHASLRDDYAVSVPAIDRLVAIAQAEPGILGARLTGGGFGGAIVALASIGHGAAAAVAIAAAYAAETGHHPTVLVPTVLVPAASGSGASTS
jgi:galactokinase